MDSTDLLMQALAQTQNAINSYSAYKQGEEALEQSQNQFDTNIAEMKRQYDTSMLFADKQHSEQMDFANRQLQANKDIANQNYELSKSAYDFNKSQREAEFNYQKELNSTIMEREDNAIRRQVADYVAAGFSPLAAIGGNGANTASLSSASGSNISPASYDASGINAAAGQYADFAKQYAALKMQAQSDYMKGRSQIAQKHNANITASKMALQQMRADMHYKNMSASTELFNAQTNYRDSLLNREYVRQQTNSLKKETEWNEIHGYRNTSPYSDIARAIEKLIPVLNKNPSIGEVKEKIKDAYEEQKLVGSGYYESPQQASKALIKLSNFLENQETNYNPFTAKEYYDKNPDIRNVYTLDEFQSLLKNGKTGKIQRALVRQALRGSINF